MPISPTRGAELRDFAETLLSFRTTAGREHVAREWLVDRLAALGFETCEWSADAETLATHPSFPDDPAAIDVEGGRASPASSSSATPTRDGRWC
ncbi:hypothetical protein VB773_18785 [Haloarculaceae archaeon H-GB2-1]|nr:hypothetical protein [Haloarculaceae archaeon H-GB2-1]